jgi:hypothetical protein
MNESVHELNTRYSSNFQKPTLSQVCLKSITALKEISGNKILLEDEGTKIFFDF